MRIELNDTRDTLSETLSVADEVYAALSKVRLANKLNCTTQDLTTMEMECPSDKMGQVIGKSGTMIAKIQESCNVVLDVDKNTSKIVLTGSETAIQQAMDEIDRIIHMEEVEVDIEQDLLLYLTAKYVRAMEEIRREYPLARVEVIRSNGRLSIRGSPEDVNAVKSKVLGILVISKSRLLEGKKQIATLLGKKGATIDKICADHSVSIEVESIDEEIASAVVLGPPSTVETVMNEIEDLMNENREESKSLEIPVIMRSILLSKGGRQIKAMQSKVTEQLPDETYCNITVNKNPIARNQPELLLKTKQSSMPEALELTKSELNALSELCVKISVDPFAVPKLIGKGGETIKKLTEGKDAFVEVDRHSGVLWYGAMTVEDRDAIEIDVNKLMESNCVLRVPADPTSIRNQFRDFTRSSVKKELDGRVRVDIDEVNSCYLLRGVKEDIEAAKTLLEDFIRNNQIGEIPITDEDREFLIIGGKNSKIAQFAEELDVKLHIDRAKYTIFIRGKQHDVDAAVVKLSQYLNGGDGYSVVKLPITTEVVGMVIGKQGKNRIELEQKHEGVKITFSKSNIITIRGPEKSVAECKIDVGNKIASARVTKEVPISDEQKAMLKKKDFARTIGPQTLVSINISGKKVVIKGSFHDVKDAASLLNEMLTGEYKTTVELDASQFAKVRNTCRDPSHFQRMEEVSGAKIELDLTSGAIAISGKRSDVKRAKDQLYTFLDFILPGDIERLKISKPLYLSVGHSAQLAQVSAASGGATVYLDRDLGLIVMRSSKLANLENATRLVSEKIKEAEKLAYVFEVSASESWLLSAIIGKDGKIISVLRAKNPSCKIDVSKEARTVTVVADSEEAVARGKEAIRDAMERAKKENIFVLIPEAYVPRFVGKGGANVKAMSTTHGTEIQRIKRNAFNFRVTGEASKVEATKAAIDKWLVQREDAEKVLSFKLEREADMSAAIGEKGFTVRSVQQEFRCTIEIDKNDLLVTVAGDSAEIRQAVMEKLKSIVAEDRQQRAAKQAAKENQPGPSQIPSTMEANPIAANDPLPVEDDDEAGDIISQFPSLPVGVAAPSNGKKNNKRSRKVDPAINHGTAAGKNLFAMLMAED
ncbi:MAG: hypothetical protein SGILL_000991 [Bacillariaceae sp.]